MVEISSLAWIVNFESPVGDGMPTLEASSKNRERNPTVYPAYNPDSGEFDLSLVAYDDKVPNYQKKLSRHLKSVSRETLKKFILNLFEDSIDRKIKNIIGRLNYCFENNVIFCNRET